MSFRWDSPGSIPGRVSRPLALVAVAWLLAAFTAPSGAEPLTIVFAPHVDLATGVTPRAVAIADLNGDGKLDLVVGNVGSASVSVFIGDGTGGFASQVPYPTGGGAWSVKLVDLNNDGKLDIVTANGDGNSASALLGQGDGTFAPAANFAAGLLAIAIAVGDLNGDGKPDLAVANHNASTVSLLLGYGDGTFHPKSDYGTGANPYSVAIGDLNQDGKPDLATAGYGAGAVSVLLGDGAGGLLPKNDTPTGAGSSSVAIADLNGDSRADLVVVNSNAGTLSVLLGGASGFLPKADVSVGSRPVSVAVGDVDGDGKLDLVVTEGNDNTVSVLLGNGNGTFAPRNDFATGHNPFSVATADLDGDGRVDLVVANANDNTVSILFQGVPPQPTSLSLVVSPSSTVFGQTVTLAASIVPGTAIGSVEFFDGNTSVGTVSLSGGGATLLVGNLAPGTHTLKATFNANALYAASSSPPVIEVVDRANTSTSLTANDNPSLFAEAVIYTASVAPVAPSTGIPDGSVQFRIDGANFGAPITLSGGGATSGATSTLSTGTHVVQVVFSGSNNFRSSTSPDLTQTVIFSTPVIVAVRDVPNDQGGHVFLTWRSPLDKPGVRAVTGYRVWRRAPNPAAPANGRERADALEGGEEMRRGQRVSYPDRPSLDGYWEAIAILPAEQLVNYAFDAPTTQDSIAGSNPYTAYFVTALTADAFVYFQSPPDSGYSVDNLSPPTPAPFNAVYTAGSVGLHWTPSLASDFREFRLYRGLAPDFVPDPASLLAATRDTGYVDPSSVPYCYKLVAVDLHGNLSRYALVTPNGPVATLAALVGVDAGPDRIRLTWYAAGNTGLVATLYRRTMSTDWEARAFVTADGTGYLRYEDDAVTTGTRYGYRLGILDGGVEVFLGEAWATAERLVFALEGARPNPTSSAELTVLFSLPTAESGTLDLIDVGGRRMRTREVGSLGPGRHAVNLSESGRIPPGVYLVRLSQGAHSLTRRVAVLP